MSESLQNAFPLASNHTRVIVNQNDMKIKLCEYMKNEMEWNVNKERVETRIAGEEHSEGE